MRAAKRPWWSLGLVAASLFCGSGAALALDMENVRNWACCYCEQARPEMAQYDLLVVDPRIQGLETLPGIAGRTVLAYLSLGEVHPGASVFAQVKETPLLLRMNQAWGSWMVDVRQARWAGLIVEEAARIRKAGFDGLFLDTLDTPVELERQEPQQYAGMAKATVQLVQTLRKSLGRKFLLCQNRGLQIAAQTAPLLDAVCLESGFSTYNAKKGRYEEVPDALQKELLALVQQARQANPDLLPLSLDYAPDPRDPLAITAVREARRHGFVPSVNTYALDTVFPPPEP